MPASLSGSLAAAIVAAIVAHASTAEAQQYEARTVAPQTVEHTPQGELMLGVTGAVLLGLPYGASVWSAAASHREGDKLLYLPVVGPWGAIIDRRACTTPGCRGDIGSDSLPLVANGLLQGAGAALIVVALTTPPHTESARPRAASSGPGRSSLQVHVVPASYVGGGGLAAFGTF